MIPPPRTHPDRPGRGTRNLRVRPTPVPRSSIPHSAIRNQRTAAGTAAPTLAANSSRVSTQPRQRSTFSRPRTCRSSPYTLATQSAMTTTWKSLLNAVNAVFRTQVLVLMPMSTVVPAPSVRKSISSPCQ